MNVISNLDQWYKSDQHLDRLYSIEIQQLSARHWTPIHVARVAADYLAANPFARILDIGSGAGKFCLCGAYFKPNATFVGVEQRSNLVQEAERMKKRLQLSNVTFKCGNFTRLDFNDYDHFYFYNSFFENLADAERIDYSIDYSVELYNYYIRYLFQQLESKPAGTRLVTFHSLEDEIPPDYEVTWTDMGDHLKCWIKQ